MSPTFSTADGNTVVLIHGWGGSAASTWNNNGWNRALSEQGCTPWAIDLPGHGTQPQPHDPEFYADLASRLQEKLPFEGPLDAIGFSLGAKVLLELAARHPHRFRRLVLGGLGGNVFTPEPLGQDLADALETGVGANTPNAVRELVEYGVSHGNDPLALAACLRRVPNPVLTPDRLAKVSCPTLLVVGKNDRVAYPAQPLGEALPDADIRILPNTAHLDLPASATFQQLAAAHLGALAD
ncbi:alpha/beta fold hydrolase [Streptomyces sp. NPDC127036]|uniref:alpha/beta fold hydrolase n=1 Tax=Streptomyces sp. NPDC127036 TaxID=3347112 RepID=UPI00365394BC